MTFRNLVQLNASRSGSRYGSGRSSTPSTTLKIAVVLPMPSASVSHSGTSGGPAHYRPGFLRAAVVVSTNSNASNACLGTMSAMNA